MRRATSHRLPDYTCDDLRRIATYFLRSRGVPVEIMSGWEANVRQETDRRIRMVLALADSDKVLAADERVAALRSYIQLREVT
jgi:hypothetical protein